MHQHGFAIRRAAPGPAFQIYRRFHVNKGQRDELREASGFGLQLAQPQQMARPMLVTIDVAVHDRRRRPQSDSVCRPHDVQPAARSDLVRTQHGSHLVVQDLGGRARQRAEAHVLQRGQKVADRHAERGRALVHFEGRERVNVDAGRRTADGLANLDVCTAGEAWFDASLHAHLGRAPLPRLARPPRNLVERQCVGPASKVFTQLAFGKGAELAFEIADVRVIDVARHDVRNHVPAHIAPQRVGSRAHGRKLVAARLKQTDDLALVERPAGGRPLNDRSERCGDGGDGSASRRRDRQRRIHSWRPAVGPRPAVGVDALNQ